MNKPDTILMTNDQLHDFRKYIDMAINSAEADLNTGCSYTREMRLVRTKLQEAKMWAGKCLEVAGAPFPAELRDKAEGDTELPEPAEPPKPTHDPGSCGNPGCDGHTGHTGGDENHEDATAATQPEEEEQGEETVDPPKEEEN